MTRCYGSCVIEGGSNISCELRITKGALIRKGFIKIKLNAILDNWEACMRCGPSKERRVVLWSSLPIAQ